MENLPGSDATLPESELAAGGETIPEAELAAAIETEAEVEAAAASATTTNAAFAASNAAAAASAKAHQDKVTKMFRLYDKDCNGSLSTAEFRRIMVKCGMKDMKVSDLFAVIDKNKDGGVDVKEFISWLFGAPEDAQRHLDRLSMSAAESMDELFDFMQEMQGSGMYNKKLDQIVVDPDRLSPERRKKMEDKGTLRELRLRDIFNACDSNKNGKLTMSEFVAGVTGLGMDCQDQMLQEIFNLVDTQRTETKRVIRMTGGTVKEVNKLTAAEITAFGGEEQVAKLLCETKLTMKDGSLSWKEFRDAFEEAPAEG